MMKAVKKIIGASLAAVTMLCAPLVQASPITFDITWANDANVTLATGVLTLDNTLIHRGGYSPISASSIQELTVTVSGAVAGNGVYNLSDFSGIFFYASSALDLTKELVGQTVYFPSYIVPNYTEEGTWAVNADGRVGGFGLVATDYATPYSYSAFGIIIGGEGDGANAQELHLTSVIARAGAENPPGGISVVPEPETYLLLLCGLMLVVVAGRFTRSRQTGSTYA